VVPPLRQWHHYFEQILMIALKGRDIIATGAARGLIALRSHVPQVICIGIRTLLIKIIDDI
jgi:hypothetical protein